MENTLRVRRAERRLSQKRLALAAGIGFDRYFRIENEYTQPTSGEQQAIAAALGIDVPTAFPQPDAGAAPTQERGVREGIVGGLNRQEEASIHNIESRS